MCCKEHGTGSIIQVHPRRFELASYRGTMLSSAARCLQ